ncbi:MAG: hypothetical protein K0Q83_1363 [Deltaproteobacteria bacterium]|jgi:hypothetical protein|nr:hypothetical protein [Deltaproteobacteria bacterium]MDF2756716.1 hypothetical protein [Nitrospira sp.]
MPLCQATGERQIGAHSHRDLMREKYRRGKSVPVALRWLSGDTGPLNLALLNCRGSKEKQK